MSSVRIKSSSCNVGAMHFQSRNGRCCATSACAVQPHWVRIWSAAIDAAMRRSPNDSCENRHCPKCQASARDRWLLKQASSLLPVPYVHAVFTVPEQLAPLGLSNQKLFYSMLFRAASETMLEIAARAAFGVRKDPTLWGACQPKSPASTGPVPVFSLCFSPSWILCG